MAYDNESDMFLPIFFLKFLQCNNAPSTRTPRGHQFPAAFMLKVLLKEKVNKNGLTYFGGHTIFILNFYHSWTRS